MSVGPGSSPRPPGWNRTIDDLMAEIDRGERSSISGEEAAWARDYERSLLPPDTVFPRDGEVWEAVGDAEVLVMHHYAAPVTDTNDAVLPGGERVRVIGSSGQDRPIIISAEPLRYDELLARLVPDDVRAEPRFANYSLMVKTAYFNQHFRRVADSAGG
ncbi:MAG TPA: hypothetical protein VM890_05005 [Longimicrobium sp.]|jgi:hypothetical protein|nr:hypothetical protein [Longimicrobium sp.]